MEDQSFVTPVLPFDCFVEIASRLCGMQDLSRLSQVSKTFHEIVDYVFDFKSDKNVNTITLTPTPFVCPPCTLRRQVKPIGKIPVCSISFPDHVMIVTTNIINGDIIHGYEFYCKELSLCAHPQYGTIEIVYSSYGNGRVFLEHDSAGRWIPSTKGLILSGENYYKNLPLILEGLKELQAWKNYCDRK